jgi:2-C-methyl-D-erythritol 4-phosphate cytidylyltransferase/2-C-methyl-D-erythritol 2,4-cyclodiphosphate synthase
MITKLITQLDKNEAVIPALKINDTLKECKNGKILQTIGRDNLLQAQTPQAFKYTNILQSHIKLSQQQFTDDAALEEYQGRDVFVIEGDSENFKITTNNDLIRAKKLMSNCKSVVRKVGIGFDVHQFCAAKDPDNNYIMLGGIKIPYTKSLAGHSDADVVIHAVVDAILGAIGQGDIGDHFPPSDNKYKDINSDFFLQEANRLIKEQNGVIINIDLTIICEEPKLYLYKNAMAKQLANILQISPAQVNVKATTTEKLGFTGRGEGIATQAIANIELSGV